MVRSTSTSELIQQFARIEDIQAIINYEFFKADFSWPLTRELTLCRSLESSCTKTLLALALHSWLNLSCRLYLTAAGLTAALCWRV